MEKKLNIRTNQAKCLITDSSKKSQETTAKQWPKNGRRRDLNSSISKSESKPFSTKTRTNYDKRPKARGYQGSSTLEEGTSTRLDDKYMFEAEVNSVFLPGAKKQSLNHLLNFNYAPRDNESSVFTKTGNHNRTYNIKKNKYNKEQYLQANCQFVVNINGDYTAYTACPDLMVDWNQIEQIVNHSSEEPQCPICLYPPVACKMTKCGHVFCWPCVLHYLALSDKTWRKCPICYESVHMADLKSAVTKPHRDYNVEDTVQFVLMRRDKESLGISKASSKIKKYDGIPHIHDNDEAIRYSKLLLANTEEIMSIVDRERNELKTQLCFDGDDCPETMFVNQALDLLMNRETSILNFEKLKKEEEESKIVCSFDEIMENMKLDEAAAASNSNISSSVDDECSNDSISVKSISSGGGGGIDENLYCQDLEMIPETYDNLQFYYFYQASDGQHVYLDSINIRMLHEMYGSIEYAPQTFTGKILQKYSCSMTEEFRKRSKFSHLPISCQFNVVEIKFDSNIISSDVLNKFKIQLNARKKLRQRKLREEKIREKHIFEANERQLGKFIERSSNIDIDSTKHFPKYSDSSLDDSVLFGIHDFESSLSPNTSCSLRNTGPSFANMLNNAPDQTWPTLAHSPSATKNVTVPQKITQITGTRQTPATTTLVRSTYTDDEDCDDPENYSVRPSPFSRNFSSAIAEAIQKVKINENNKNTNETGGKKKKNKKKTLLFSTGMHSMNDR